MPAARASRIQRTSPSEPVGARIEDVQGRDLTGVDGRLQRAQVGSDARVVERGRDEAEQPGAADVRCVDGRHDELRVGRLRFRRHAPRHATIAPSPINSSASRRNRNISSCDAWADRRNRTPSGFLRPATASRSTSVDIRSCHATGVCTPALASKQRTAEAIVAFDPVVVEPADVAHPIAVHVRVEPGREADQPRALCPLGLRLEPRRRVAALRAERADRVDRVRVVPRPRLEPVVARRDRADRADVHQVAREQRVHAFLLEGRDLAAVAAIDDVDLGVAVDVAHEPDAARAEDAALAVEHQRRAEVDVAACTPSPSNTRRGNSIRL